jgi:hypothetical protein
MKKYTLLFAIAAMFVIASCNNTATETQATSTDSTAQVDSNVAPEATATPVDTAAVK